MCTHLCCLEQGTLLLLYCNIEQQYIVTWEAILSKALAHDYLVKNMTNEGNKQEIQVNMQEIRVNTQEV